jgi:aminoglycoside phosphotransferase (APT) family kinase protein
MPEHSSPQGLRSAVRTIITNVIGESPTRVTALHRGVMTFKFVAWLKSGERYIVRFYPSSRSHIVNYEADILRRCVRAGLTAPDPLADSRSGPPAPLAYIVYKRIEGRTASDRYAGLSSADRAGLAVQLADALRILAGIHMKGYGDPFDGTSAVFQTWRDFVRTSLDEGLRLARRYGSLPQALLTTLERMDPGRNGCGIDRPGVLAWGDISLENILLNDRNQVCGLVDFEGVLAAEPLLALGYCQAAYAKTEFFRFLKKAWSTALDAERQDRIDFYAVLRVLRVAKFAHEPLPTGIARRSLLRMFPGFAPSVQRLAKIEGGKSWLTRTTPTKTPPN